MATNLVSDIGEFLGPQIVSRIASSLGLDKTSTQKAAECGDTRPSHCPHLARFQVPGRSHAQRRCSAAGARGPIELGRC